MTVRTIWLNGSPSSVPLTKQAHPLTQVVSALAEAVTADGRRALWVLQQLGRFGQD